MTAWTMNCMDRSQLVKCDPAMVALFLPHGQAAQDAQRKEANGHHEAATGERVFQCSPATCRTAANKDHLCRWLDDYRRSIPCLIRLRWVMVWLMLRVAGSRMHRLKVSCRRWRWRWRILHRLLIVRWNVTMEKESVKAWDWISRVRLTIIIGRVWRRFLELRSTHGTGNDDWMREREEAMRRVRAQVAEK